MLFQLYFVVYLYSIHWIPVLIHYDLLTVLSSIWRGIPSLQKKTFGRQKWFDCISKLFFSHYPIWSNFRKVVFFRLFIISLFCLSSLCCFKFLSTNDKPWLEQIKIISVLPLVERFSSIGTKQGKHLAPRTNMKPQQIIKDNKISYSLASHIFRKFWCVTYRNGLNRSTSKLKYSKYLKKYEPC